MPTRLQPGRQARQAFLGTSHSLASLIAYMPVGSLSVDLLALCIQACLLLCPLSAPEYVDKRDCRLRYFCCVLAGGLLSTHPGTLAFLKRGV